MDRLAQDLRLAVRSLLHRPAFSIVAVVTLALGVGAATAIFSVVNGVLIKPLPYDRADRLVAFGQTLRTNPSEPVDGSSSHLNFLDWQRRSTTIPEMALYAASRAVISNGGEADVVRVGIVTRDIFGVFRATPVRGRTFTADEQLPNGPRAVIVSYGFWQERFGGRDDILSQTVEVSGTPLPIVGVAPRGFDFPAGARLWLPVRNDDEQCGRACVYLNGVGRLADGVSVEAAAEEMASIASALEREYPQANFDVTVAVQSLQDRAVGSVRIALVVLLAAVGMLLLIACANVANLVLVRESGRRGELAVRTALGAGRRRLVAMLLTENLVLAFAGGAAGLAVAWVAIASLEAYAPVNLPRLDEVTLDVATFTFALAMIAFTVVSFGLGPALQVAREPAVEQLAHRGAIGARRGRSGRAALLVAEVGLSLVLLLGAGLLLRSVMALQRTDLGFDPGGVSVFTLSLPPARYPAPQVVAVHERIDEELRAMPGVTQVARISGLPLGPSENALNFTRPDQPPPPPGQAPTALYRVVDAEYFDAMRIRIVRGRAFTPTDRAGAPRVAIISQRMADMFWPGEDPVDRPLSISGSDPATIVGVAANVRSQTLASQAQPEMYVPHAQTNARTVTYVLKGDLPPAQVTAAARDVVRRVDARLPLIGASAMQQLVDEQLARPRFYLLLLGLFATLAVVLAAVGIYGVVAFVVSQRTREIGLRMALGARHGQVIGLMLWEGLRPAAVGMATGLAAAAAGARVMQSLLYEVQPHDPATVAGVSALLLAIVLAACAVPARRATRVPPAEALRD